MKRTLTIALAGGFILSCAAAGCGDDGTDDPDGTGASGASTPGSVTPAPGGIRKLTSSQFRYSVEYLLGTPAATLVDLPDDPQLHGFESIAAAELSLSANEVDGLEFNVTTLIDEALVDVTPLARFAPCVMNAPAAACYSEVVDKFGRVAWRRPVDADEKARLIDIATAGQAWGDGDFDQGLKYMLMEILQSPNFVYISEIGEAEPIEPGKFVLTGSELATRMAFFIQHRTPDVELLDAAEAGELADVEGIRTHAKRLLATPEARRALDRYYSEAYLIRDISDISKDETLYPGWTDQLAASMQEEMLRFIADIVWTRDADARELFTSDTTFINADLAAHYGIDAPTTAWGKVTLPADQKRAGILGKAGYLARFSQADRSSPTRRGRFFWEHLMCEEIPPPPAGVDTTLPDDEPGNPTTTREKVEQHMDDAKCAGCHGKMDPPGLALENYDAIGSFRTEENSLPIDTSGLEYAKLGTFSSADDLGAVISEDERTTLCLIKGFVRGSMGHLETEGEAAAIDAIHKAFESSGYSMQDMMVELTTSLAFRLVADPK